MRIPPPCTLPRSSAPKLVRTQFMSMVTRANETETNVFDNKRGGLQELEEGCIQMWMIDSLGCGGWLCSNRRLRATIKEGDTRCG